MIFDRHVNLKYKYENQHFWVKRYYMDTVGRNKKQILVRRRQDADQISRREFIDPFANSRNIEV